MFSLEIPNSENYKQRPSNAALKPKNRLALVLFLLSLFVYLTTRLIRLPDFPIYFFTDEAIQTQHAVDLVANRFRSPEGVLLYFFRPILKMAGNITSACRFMPRSYLP